jgi:hypothetical protein
MLCTKLMVHSTSLHSPSAKRQGQNLSDMVLFLKSAEWGISLSRKATIMIQIRVEFCACFCVDVLQQFTLLHFHRYSVIKELRSNLARKVPTRSTKLCLIKTKTHPTPTYTLKLTNFCTSVAVACTTRRSLGFFTLLYRKNERCSKYIIRMEWWGSGLVAHLWSVVTERKRMEVV